MKTDTIASPKNNWASYLLWPNLAVGIVLFVLIASGQITNIHDLWWPAVYALTYSNLVALFGTLVFGGLAKKLDFRKFTIVVPCVLGFIPVGILMAQTFLWAVGFEVPQHFWPKYVHTLKICTPLGILFGVAAWAHMSLRERAQSAEKKLQDKELGEQRAMKLAAEARLHSLESRIQPHFLFNTLNSISSLIAVNPALAEQTVGRLATLLRASLDSSNQPLIPLRQEMEMVQSYIEIEKVRYGDKLRGSIEAPTDLQGAMVPPMSIQTLVENAVKHGISCQIGGGDIVIAASSEDGKLRIEVRDTGPGFDLTAIPAGHGLDNLVERLDALFGAKARLNVLRRDGYSVVEMLLPRL